MKIIKLTLLDYEEVGLRIVRKIYHKSGYAYINVENIATIEQKWFEYIDPETDRRDGYYGSLLYINNGKYFYIKEPPEEIIEMINSKTETTQTVITPEELREMMKDPKYWRDQEPEYVRKVENGFKKLYGGK